MLEIVKGLSKCSPDSVVEAGNKGCGRLVSSKSSSRAACCDGGGLGSLAPLTLFSSGLGSARGGRDSWCIDCRSPASFWLSCRGCCGSGLSDVAEPSFSGMDCENHFVASSLGFVEKVVGVDLSVRLGPKREATPGFSRRGLVRDSLNTQHSVKWLLRSLP